MNYVKIDGHSGYVRDKGSGAVLNTNKAEIEAARKRKLERKSKEKEIDDLKNEVEMTLKLSEKIRYLN